VADMERIKNMDESESKNEKPKEERRFDPELLKKGLRCDQEQYDMLKRCSDKKDMTEWNEWRKANPEEEILLEGMDLIKSNLDDVNLSSAHLENSKLRGSYLKHADFENAHLESADLSLAHLDCADLAEAHLEKSRLSHAFIRYSTLEKAHLEGSDLTNAHLEGAALNGANLTRASLKDADLQRATLEESCLKEADLSHAHLEHVDLIWANLKNANLFGAHLENAHVISADLRKAMLSNAHLQGADFGPELGKTRLEGAFFENAIMNGSTLIWHCSVDRCTNFQGVGLDSARIDTGTKQLLEYNIRRNNWDDWYKEHCLLRWPVWLFWLISDYGLRTWRVIATFFGLAIAFGVVYWLCPSCVMVNDVVGDIRGFWHALYFSVVTMTTLGFGDIAANPDSWGGQTLLMLQVILGYVLLGALVTRFAVLFTAGGPAGKFSKEKKE